MKFISWLKDSWKAIAWKKGAWKEEEEEPRILASLGGFAPSAYKKPEEEKPEEEKPVEEKEESPQDSGNLEGFGKEKVVLGQASEFEYTLDSIQAKEGEQYYEFTFKISSFISPRALELKVFLQKSFEAKAF